VCDLEDRDAVARRGSSEEILGRALKDYANRDDVVIATKLRHPMRPGPNGKGLSRKAIMTQVDHSLTRLGTDYINLYQIHRNDHATPLEEKLEALHDLVKVLRVTHHECRTSFLMNMDESYEADRNPLAMVTVTLSCSP
jgi:aryl-alcohol dehydrogenase-like predicted oxidoreductase